MNWWGRTFDICCEQRLLNNDIYTINMYTRKSILLFNKYDKYLRHYILNQQPLLQWMLWYALISESSRIESWKKVLEFPRNLNKHRYFFFDTKWKTNIKSKWHEKWWAVRGAAKYSLLDRNFVVFIHFFHNLYRFTRENPQ